MEENPRSLKRRVLCALVLTLMTAVCYQLGHLQGYEEASRELAGRPQYWASGDDEAAAYEDAQGTHNAADAVALKTVAGEDGCIPKS